MTEFINKKSKIQASSSKKLQQTTPAANSTANKTAKGFKTSIKELEIPRTAATKLQLKQGTAPWINNNLLIHMRPW